MFTTVNLILILTKELFRVHRSEVVNKPILYLTIGAALVLLPDIWEGLRLQWIQISIQMNDRVSERLNLSKKTVANYISTIMNKLQVQDREEAIRLAREARGK